MIKNFTIRQVLLATICSSLLLFSACSKEEDPQPQADATSSGGVVEPIVESVIPNQYIVVLQDNYSDSLAGMTYDSKLAKVQNMSSNILDILGLGTIIPAVTFGEALIGFVYTGSQAEADQLAADPRVKYVEQDYTIGFEPLLDLLFPAPEDNTSQEKAWGVQRTGTANGVGKVAWIIDTGIEYNHDDLTVDESNSRSFVAGTFSANDDNGHGTHCGGIVAAKDNNIGVVGVAAGATLVAVKVLNAQGSGSISNVIRGVDYTAGNASAGHVANLSLGGGVHRPLDEAVQGLGAKGILVALAAGNNGQSAANSSPARTNGTNIYTVSAMQQGDRWASYSNFGNPPIEFCEPGSNINSTYINNTYTELSGTSMAAPHLAGILLITGGNPVQDGTVSGDPDGNADPIGTL